MSKQYNYMQHIDADGKQEHSTYFVDELGVLRDIEFAPEMYRVGGWDSYNGTSCTLFFELDREYKIYQ